LAAEVIKKYKNQIPIVALKIITITGKRGICQRGTVGCGICTSIDSGYELIEEENVRGNKDTMQLLRSGAMQVFLLKAFEDSLKEGFYEFLKQIPKDALIICESNTLRKYVKPGLFIMMENRKKKMKPTAQMVYDLADKVLTTEEVEAVSIEKQKWQLAQAVCL